MKSVNKLLTGSLIGCLFIPAVQAAEVSVTWQDPDSYRDIDPANQSRSAFRKSVFTQFEAYFAELAEDLPDDAKWDITVTNVDLAGQVWPASFVGVGSAAGDVRMVKRVDIPRIAFSYTLKDASGTVLKSADVSLKDMAFMERVSARSGNDNLRYERYMLKDWFEEELGDSQLTSQ